MDFKEHLFKYLDEESINKLLDSLKEEDQHAVLLNTKKISNEMFIKHFPKVIPHPFVKNAYIYDKNKYALGKHIFHNLGAYYLQEPSAMMPSFLLQPKEGETVLDLCAAPGGKSVQASFLMNNKGLILSNDLSFERSKIIKENVERLGIGNILITSNDFSNHYYNYRNTFDKIILDAPCSGSGMFRKHDLMSNDWSYNKVIKNQAIQKELIIYCYEMLKPGGAMVYSTCSFSYEEDEEVIMHLLDNTNAEIIDIENNPLFYKSKSCLGIHLFPHLFPGEGHYICLIKKPGFIGDKTKNIKQDSLFAKLKLHSDYNYTDKYQNTLFIHDVDFALKKLSIIRYGVKVGEILPNDIKYDIHYARYIKDFDNVLELDEVSCLLYLKGNALNIETKKGYILIRYNGINIDLAKSDSRIIKNRYPKHMRIK